MTERQLIGLLMLIGIPTICVILLTLITSYWIGVIKRNKDNIRDFLHKPPTRKEPKEPLTQQSFEEWKAEKRKRDQGGFVDLDAPVRLPWRRTA